MKTLLIVDDEYWIRYKLIHRYEWARFGFTEVLDAANGEEALSIIEKHNVDLVITDMDMPIVDGATFMTQLRKSNPQLPVLVLSGYSDFQTVHGAILGGASDYLLKPVKDEDLYTAVARLIEPDKADLSEFEPVHSENAEGFIREIGDYINNHFEEDLSLASLSKSFALSPSYLSRSFKKEYGINLISYINRLRLDTAKELFDGGEKSISSVATHVGYDDYAYFSVLFKKQFGISPREYLKQIG